MLKRVIAGVFPIVSSWQNGQFDVHKNFNCILDVADKHQGCDKYLFNLLGNSALNGVTDSECLDLLLESLKTNTVAAVQHVIDTLPCDSDGNVSIDHMRPILKLMSFGVIEADIRWHDVNSVVLELIISGLASGQIDKTFISIAAKSIDTVNPSGMGLAMEIYREKPRAEKPGTSSGDHMFLYKMDGASPSVVDAGSLRSIAKNNINAIRISKDEAGSIAENLHDAFDHNGPAAIIASDGEGLSVENYGRWTAKPHSKHERVFALVSERSTLDAFESDLLEYATRAPGTMAGKGKGKLA